MKTTMKAMLGALLALITTSCTITRTVTDGTQMGQNPQPAAVMNGGQQVGQMISSEIFGNQPTTPTPDAIRIPWEQAFGTDQTVWVNDFGRGRAKVQMAQTGRTILFDRYYKWAWLPECHNRVVPLTAPQAPAPQPPAPLARSGWSFNFNLPPIVVTQEPYCRPPMPMQRHMQMCPPPMQRQVYVQRPCPMPCLPRPMCR